MQNITQEFNINWKLTLNKKIRFKSKKSDLNQKNPIFYFY